MRIQRCFAAFLIAASLPLFSAAQTSIAFERAQHLERGINTSMWFAQASDYSTQRLQTYTTADDIALIAKMGFDHCRLSIDGDQLMTWFYTQRDAHKQTGFMIELDRVVKTMLDDHLSVIIDIHPPRSSRRSCSREAAASAISSSCGARLPSTTLPPILSVCSSRS